MATRYYLSQLVGTGTMADPFRPALLVVAPGVRMSICDGRAAATSAAGIVLVIADVSDDEHAKLVLDPRLTYLPIEHADGSLIAPSGRVGDIPLRNRLVVRNALATWGFDTSVLTADATIQDSFAALRPKG